MLAPFAATGDVGVHHAWVSVFKTHTKQAVVTVVLPAGSGQ